MAHPGSQSIGPHLSQKGEYPTFVTGPEPDATRRYAVTGEALIPIIAADEAARGKAEVQRVTVTLDDDLLSSLDALAAERGYGSRSEALRDLVRDGLNRQAHAAGSQPSYGTLSYVYDHETRDLARRLTHSQHSHHDLTVASLHVHLDHDACLEVAVLRGRSDDLRRLADEMTNQRGVRFGQLHLIPDSDAARAPHPHSTPSTA